MTSLYKYANYNAPISYLFDKAICEFDISKANISILREMDVISQKTYEDLKNADRMPRQYFIGCLIRDDPTIQDKLNVGLEMARSKFCKELNLEDTNILHIVKDAIFVVKNMHSGHLPDTVQVSDLVSFTCRGRYTNYLRLFPGMYIYHDRNNPDLRIRGMGELAQSLHKDYFMQMIRGILDSRQMVGFNAAYNLAKACYSQLLNRTCPVENMRRFDSNSLYDFKEISTFCKFQADYLSEGAEMMVDPSFNMSILETIGNYLMCDEMSSK